MSMLEAKCTRCDEIFVPHGTDPKDLIHCFKGADGEEECGGIGVIQGVWSIKGAKDTVDMKFDSVVRMERHGMDNPHCSDPDCEYHHPEVREF